MILICAMQASAYHADTAWRRYPAFADSIDDIAVTKRYCYFTSGTQLYAYSDATEELRACDNLGMLSEIGVTGIYAPAASEYVLITYASGNIDVAYDDGRVVTLPDIRDAEIDYPAGINNVAFGGGRIVVCTEFGIVEYDEKRLEVADVGMYGLNTLSAAVCDEHLVICVRSGDDGHFLYSAPVSAKHGKIENFKKSSFSIYSSDLAPLGNGAILERAKNTGKINRINIDYATGQISREPVTEAAAMQPLRKCGKGYYTATADSIYSFFGGTVHAMKIADAIRGNKYALGFDGKYLWAGDGTGIGKYSIGDGDAVMIHDRIKPRDAMSCVNVGYMKWSPDGERLYVSNLCASQLRSGAPGEGIEHQCTDIIGRAGVTGASLTKASADHKVDIANQSMHGNSRMYGDAMWVAEDPDDSNVYYCANNHEGLYVLRYSAESGKYNEVGKFTTYNSPIVDNWGARVTDVNFDRQGNLWMGFRGGCGYAVLPAEKRRLGPDGIDKNDWKKLDYLSGCKIEYVDMMSLLCRKSDAALIIQGKYDFGIVGIDTRGTWSDPTDDICSHIESFTDQDGNTLKFHYASFLLEDSNGSVWVGTSDGIFVIDDPVAFVHNPALPVRRLKVSRNDGTNFADYLLGGDQVNWMAQDDAGRKWIATEHSGLYLVNAAGDEILRHYTADNSPLPSNTVNAVEYSPRYGMVYAGTSAGLYTAMASSIAPQDDYSGVVVYPNPVRPEYSGDVTISGLRDNSVVKISDTGGNVVFATRSQGSVAVWPLGSASVGVRSGIYYIYVASDIDGATSEIVTKVAIVR